MYVAIDIGGTKTEVGFYGSQDPSSLVHSEIFSTEKMYGPQMKRLLPILASQIKEKVQGMAVSFPGIVMPSGDIRQVSNIPDYEGKPLRDDLSKQCGVTARIVQDSACAALATYLYGGVASYARVVHIIVGTSLGATRIEKINAQVMVSPFEACGMIVDVRDGRKHEMNKTLGLLEAYVGGGNVEHTYKRSLADVSDDDPLWDEITDYLAVGINNIACVFKPDIVVLGGGIGMKRKKSLAPVIEKIKLYNEFVDPPMVQFTKIEGNESPLGALAVQFVDNIQLQS